MAILAGSDPGLSISAHHGMDRCCCVAATVYFEVDWADVVPCPQILWAGAEAGVHHVRGKRRSGYRPQPPSHPQQGQQGPGMGVFQVNNDRVGGRYPPLNS